MRTNGVGRDSPFSLAYAAKLFRMSQVHQLGLGTNPIQNGPEGPLPIGKEHGELGILQEFIPGSGVPTLVGGGRPSGGQVSSEPSSTPLVAGVEAPAFARFSGGLRGI